MSLFGQKKNTASQEIEKKRKENENVSDWSRDTTNQKSLSFEGHPLRSDTSITGAKGLSFYYSRLLNCLNQMLAVVLLS